MTPINDYSCHVIVYFKELMNTQQLLINRSLSNRISINRSIVVKRDYNSTDYRHQCIRSIDWLHQLSSVCGPLHRNCHLSTLAVQSLLFIVTKSIYDHDGQRESLHLNFGGRGQSTVLPHSLDCATVLPLHHFLTHSLSESMNV